MFTRETILPHRICDAPFKVRDIRHTSRQRVCAISGSFNYHHLLSVELVTTGMMYRKGTCLHVLISHLVLQKTFTVSLLDYLHTRPRTVHTHSSKRDLQCLNIVDTLGSHQYWLYIQLPPVVRWYNTSCRRNILNQQTGTKCTRWNQHPYKIVTYC